MKLQCSIKKAPVTGAFYFQLSCLKILKALNNCF